MKNLNDDAQEEAHDSTFIPGDLKARAAVSAGIEDSIEALRVLPTGRRLFESSFFVLLFLLGATINITAVAYQPHSWTYASLFLGTACAALGLNAIVLLMHEGMHHTLLPQPWLNRWVSVFFGASALISFSAYQVMHIRHHHYLGDPRDPDDYNNYSGSPRVVWAMHYLRLFAGSFLYLFCIPWLSMKFGTTTQRRRIMQEYVLLGVVYSTLLYFVPASVLLWGWILPLLGAGFLINLRGFTQHGITDAHDPFLASRSIFPGRLMSFLLLNENLHLEHHLFPDVPSHNLPAVHALIAAKLPRRVAGDSYLGFLLEFLRRTVNLDDRPIGRRDGSDTEWNTRPGTHA